MLDAFVIDWAACMFCGICVEECPFDALAWASDHVPAASHPSALRHDRHELGEPGEPTVTT